MVTPAMQLASKIPDIHVQLWGSAILKDLHRMSKDVQHEKEAYANHVKYSENLIADQRKCAQSMHHALINWFSGEPPLSGPAHNNNSQSSGVVITEIPAETSVIHQTHHQPQVQQQQHVVQQQQQPPLPMQVDAAPQQQQHMPHQQMHMQQQQQMLMQQQQHLQQQQYIHQQQQQATLPVLNTAPSTSIAAAQQMQQMYQQQLQHQQQHQQQQQHLHQPQFY